MHGVTTPSATSPVRTPAWPLIAVGAVGGAFSALFGVGGGVVMVPLLILLCGYGSRAATATSLAAIAIIALVGTTTHGVLGNVDWLAALLVGIPALLGVTLGVKVRARISSVTISRAFAVLLIIAAVLLAVDL
ncbi:MAG: sulfite exporter TauE/SafE family protein [Actinobacteria bacterium]|nr:sulfite exporter TauE/SafE family protein [Actinomycetota bacterium]